MKIETKLIPIQWANYSKLINVIVKLDDFQLMGQHSFIEINHDIVFDYFKTIDFTLLKLINMDRAPSPKDSEISWNLSFEREYLTVEITDELIEKITQSILDQVHV